MEGFSANASVWLIKAKNWVMEYFFVLIQWKLKWFKVQWHKLTRARELKQLQKAYSGLGAEVYAQIKNGQTGWQDNPMLANQVSQIEQAEARVLRVDELIDQLDQSYRAKREELRKRYSGASNAEADPSA